MSFDSTKSQGRQTQEAKNRLDHFTLPLHEIFHI